MRVCPRRHYHSTITGSLVWCQDCGAIAPNVKNAEWTYPAITETLRGRKGVNSYPADGVYARLESGEGGDPNDRSPDSPDLCSPHSMEVAAGT